MGAVEGYRAAFLKAIHARKRNTSVEAAELKAAALWDATLASFFTPAPEATRRTSVESPPAKPRERTPRTVSTTPLVDDEITQVRALEAEILAKAFPITIDADGTETIDFIAVKPHFRGIGNLQQRIIFGSYVYGKSFEEIAGEINKNDVTTEVVKIQYDRGLLKLATNLGIRLKK